MIQCARKIPSVREAKLMNSLVQHTMKSFLNPYTKQLIVVFNNVWLAASWQSCPHCIYFLSDAPLNNSVIPCGPHHPDSTETPISLTSGPLTHPWRQSQSHSPYLHFIPLLPMLCSPCLFITAFPSHCCAYYVHTLHSLLTLWSIAHLGKVKSVEMLALSSFRLGCFIK